MRLLLLFTFIGLGGCDVIPGTDAYLIKNAKTAVSAELLDPASASYRNIKSVTVGEHKFVCGEVNSKNQFGGYAGWQRFETIESEVSTHLITWPDKLENELVDDKYDDTLTFAQDQVKLFCGISKTDCEEAKRSRDDLIWSSRLGREAIERMLSSYADICTGGK